MIISRKVVSLFLIMAFLIMSFSQFSFSSEIKIRIIKNGAELRLNPTNDSQVLKELPLGGELTALERIGDWYKIILTEKDKEIPITGYVHSSYVELSSLDKDTKEKQVDISIPGNIKNVDQADNYLNWQERLSKARSKSTLGAILAIVGTAIAIPSIYLTVYYLNDKDKYGHPISTPVGAFVLLAAVDLIGIAGLVTGLALVSSGTSSINNLNNEGKLKGFNIQASLVAHLNTIGFTISLSF